MLSIPTLLSKIHYYINPNDFIISFIISINLLKFSSLIIYFNKFIKYIGIFEFFIMSIFPS